ncbi:MAG TPA: hypothetical protein VGQ28_10545, partial [Thermoanaerobaculia bacterium]|nr:hypothetical protein [Thermoanaerobaculia bacterium]
MPRNPRCAAGLLAVALFALTFQEAGAASHSALRADRILVEKSARRLTLLWQGRPLKYYRVALGDKPAGRKQCQG